MKPGQHQKQGSNWKLNEIKFSNWMPGQPDGDVNKKCLDMLQNGKWNDRFCWQANPFVCEIDWRFLVVFILFHRRNKFDLDSESDENLTLSLCIGNVLKINPWTNIFSSFDQSVIDYFVVSIWFWKLQILKCMLHFRMVCLYWVNNIGNMVC